MASKYIEKNTFRFRSKTQQIIVARDNICGHLISTTGGFYSTPASIQNQFHIFIKIKKHTINASTHAFKHTIHITMNVRHFQNAVL
ncbi:hypothetical protein D3C77_674470 [compost metagenome]